MSYGEELAEEIFIAEYIEYLEMYDNVHAGIWTTKDGEKINIKNMKEDHIRNCINMLERNKYKNELTELWILKFKNELEWRSLFYYL